MRFYDNRLSAAMELADNLAYLRDKHPVVLGIPNNGVKLAEAIADRLDVPLDILLISKLGPPQSDDQIVGAVDEHGRISLIESAARWHHLSSRQLIEPARKAFAELQKRRGHFRAILPEQEVRGRTLIIVDEAVDSGATMLAAIASVRDRGAREVIVAAPAGPGKAISQIRQAADGVVINHALTEDQGVESIYEKYSHVSDAEVSNILERWVSARPEHHHGVRTLTMRLVSHHQQVLHCELDLPPGMTRGSGPYPAVIFAHGFESDSHSTRSVPLSRRLAKRGVIGARLDFTGHGRSEGTTEEATPQRMLEDLATVHENLRVMDEIDSGCIGLNGAGSGAGVVLRYAAKHHDISALVIRGPIAGDEIEAAQHVEAPTLIIHAERDLELSLTAEDINRQLKATHELLVIPDCDRLFNDPISRELMINASVDWLVDHARACRAGSPPSPTAAAEAGTQR